MKHIERTVSQMIGSSECLATCPFTMVIDSTIVIYRPRTLYSSSDVLLTKQGRASARMNSSSSLARPDIYDFTFAAAMAAGPADCFLICA